VISRKHAGRAEKLWLECDIDVTITIVGEHQSQVESDLAVANAAKDKRQRRIRT
jgi:hypothetical protein